MRYTVERDKRHKALGMDYEYIKRILVHLGYEVTIDSDRGIVDVDKEIATNHRAQMAAAQWYLFCPTNRKKS